MIDLRLQFSSTKHASVPSSARHRELLSTTPVATSNQIGLCADDSISAGLRTTASSISQCLEIAPISKSSRLPDAYKRSVRKSSVTMVIDCAGSIASPVTSRGDRYSESQTNHHAADPIVQAVETIHRRSEVLSSKSSCDNGTRASLRVSQLRRRQWESVSNNRCSRSL